MTSSQPGSPTSLLSAEKAAEVRERFGTPCYVFPWYNTEHHHSGLGLLTPADVHHSLAARRLAARATVLTTAYAAHPERFPGGRSHPRVRPVDVWINRPQTRADQVPDQFLLADRDPDAAQRMPR